MLAPKPSSCRKLGAALGLDKMTVWSLRRKLSERFAIVTAAPGAEPIAIARSSTREWVDHARDPMSFLEPDRLRWVDYRRHRLPLPQPMARYRIAIEATMDETGAWWAAVFPSQSATTVSSFAAQDSPQHVERRPSTLGVNNERSDFAPNEQLEGQSVMPPSAAGIEPSEPLSQSGIVERLITELELFLRPFCGPATKHLGGYVAWFVARLPGGERWHCETARRLLFGDKPPQDSDVRGRHSAGQVMTF